MIRWRTHPWLTSAVALMLILLGAAATVIALNLRDEAPMADQPPAFLPSADQIERGAYLARAGNCMACHTARGGAAYAGGRGIQTPFGVVFASNLTPDAETGLGTWTSAHFWRALHNGRSRDGRLLYPAFPYTEFTKVTRDDSDALFAFLQSLTPVRQPDREHQLRFPYNSQLALAGWRALYFSPGVYTPDAGQSAAWNRGAYLVRGLAHCNACHAGRNEFGASTSLELGGGLIPMQNWYAPSLASDAEAGVTHWREADIVALLKTGVAPQGSVLGPMAEVVFSSTQHLSEPDLGAIAHFLKAIPPSPPKTPAVLTTADAPTQQRGAKLYEDHCAGCHGKQGEGALTADGKPAYPPLAGNRTVTMNPPANLIRIVANGGFLPSTPGNPQPFGMPPFSQLLSDADIAAVITFIRTAWGNQAGALTPDELRRYRQSARD